MQMKKRVLSVLLALCLAGSLASTAWAAGDQATPETAEADTSAVVLNEEEEQQDETTASQEETSGEDSTAAPAEDPVAQVTETEADDGSVEYTAALETDGQTMNVVVTAPEGAFAEDVQPELSVTMLTAEDELNAVADELDAAEVAYDGFAALDITFTDKATGEEIEPVQQVSVRIELPQTIVDSGIDLNTLAVQHLEEDADGNVQNVTEVATLDNGITLSEEAAAAANEAAGVAPMSDMPAEEAAETPAAVAEFDVDGFSSFVITWSSYFKVTVHYVDEDGKDIQGTHADNVTISSSYNNSINFDDYAGSIVDYTYQEARYGSESGDVVTHMVAETETGWFGSTRTLTFYNDSAKVAKLEYYYKTQTADIYLVYKAEETTEPGGDEGGTTVTNATVTTTKTAYLKDDDSGNYDLTLSISGTRGSATEQAAVDVLFIVDRSASMTSNGSRRLTNAKTAMNTLVNSLEDNENIDAQYSIVTFSGRTDSHWGGSTSDASVRMDWTKVNGNNVSNYINAITASGGTNYEAGLDKGLDQLRTARSNSVKVVIFLSDGEPTWSYDYGYGNEALCREWHENSRYHTCTYQGWVDTLNEASQISCGYFYAISLGGEASDYMKDLVNEVNASTKQAIEAASDGSNLTDLFKNITADVTFFAATDVTITDPLSEYADLVLTSGAPQFTITVTREASDDVEAGFWSGTVGPDGTVTFQDAKGNSQTATARVSENNSIIYMDLPDAYELEPGYTYSISTVIAPSDMAKQEYATTKAYTETPDTGTGTHADAEEQGFWSNDNDNAKVTFTANSVPGSENFPKPVIRVPEIKTADLTITKNVQGIDSADLSTVNEQKFSFKVEKLNEDGELDTDFAENDFKGGQKTVEITVNANGDGTEVLEDLPLGEYKVTETNWPQEFGDYTFDTKSGEKTAILEDESGDSVTVTNTYKHKDKVLTVTKLVAGTMVTDGDTFNFTLTLTDENGDAYIGAIPENSELTKGTQNGEYTFTLTGNMSIPNSLEITLPYNVCATVTEATAEGYTTVEHREYATESTETENFTEGQSSNTVTMNQDYTIEFRNTKNLVGPPTGLNRNGTPYTLMVTAAGIAGLALIGGIVAARRRRRRME